MVPFKLATAPVTAPCISDKLLVITLEVNVDALKLCSAYNVMDASNALTTSLLGLFQNTYEKNFRKNLNHC